MRIIHAAETNLQMYADAIVFDSSCCGDDCKLKCKKCPPMKD